MKPSTKTLRAYRRPIRSGVSFKALTSTSPQTRSTMRLGLMMLREPILKRGIVIEGIFLPQLHEPPGDAQFLAGAEVVGAGEAGEQMKRGWPAVGAEAADPAVRRHEIQARLRLHEMVDADRFAEVRQVGAATHTDASWQVVSDELAGGAVVKGAGPAAEPAAIFSTARVPERARSGWLPCWRSRVCWNQVPMRLRRARRSIRWRRKSRTSRRRRNR